MAQSANFLPKGGITKEFIIRESVKVMLWLILISIIQLSYDLENNNDVKQVDIIYKNQALHV